MWRHWRPRREMHGLPLCSSIAGMLLKIHCLFLQAAAFWISKPKNKPVSILQIWICKDEEIREKNPTHFAESDAEPDFYQLEMKVWTYAAQAPGSWSLLVFSMGWCSSCSPLQLQQSSAASKLRPPLMCWWADNKKVFHSCGILWNSSGGKKTLFLSLWTAS